MITCQSCELTRARIKAKVYDVLGWSYNKIADKLNEFQRLHDVSYVRVENVISEQLTRQAQQYPFTAHVLLSRKVTKHEPDTSYARIENARSAV